MRNPDATPPSALRSYASRLSVCLVALTLATLATSATARAEAEDSAAVEKVTKLNKKAVDEYNNLNFEEARKLLKSALEVCTQSNLDNHPVTARTYIHLGIVVFNGFKQRDEAVKLFKKALEIQADIKLDKILATPETQEVFDEAVAGMKEVKPPEPPKPGTIEHEPITKSPQGSPITIKATVDPSMGAKKVVLSFSADGADDFAEKEMKEDPPGSGFYIAEIPASATQGAVVDYFIEALGAGDSPIATKGSTNKTMKVAMLDGKGQPLVRPPGKGKPPKDKDAEPEETPSWFFGLGIGSGVGWATGKGEVNDMDMVKPAGFAMSKLVHFAPEVGYYLAPDLMVSLQLRFQLISGGTPFYGDPSCGSDMICSPGTYAFAGFGRIYYFFGEGDLRTYVAGIGGLGTIRHLATFESQVHCGAPPPGMTMGNQTCIDTVPSGPIFVGGGAGIMYNVSPAFALTFGTNALVGFTKFTFHVDLNAGVAFEY